MPDLEARLGMFKIHVGDTPNELTEDDYYQFAEQTEGFSGSDISTVVKSALMEPVRRCHKSLYFT